MTKTTISVIPNPNYVTPSQTDPQWGYTPVPNYLIDQVMPVLSDTAWRVLLVVARQTLGWQSATASDNARRKRADWLSQSQLKGRTGRASAALSEAIDGLVRRGLIVVSSAGGTPLDTAASRRSHHGTCYFRLSETILARCGKAVDKSGFGSSQSEHRNANTTKETHTKELVVVVVVGRDKIVRHNGTYPTGPDLE